MICPKCNSKLPEGMLYCEKCGTEINIVPDFVPE
ncbi:MAG: zinc-ribbon domain-containing protein, partial [Lachnospiraceae bacterium]|nr:zinc-ribbon domain-containing protein [Lachnospiraceae bacterium]